jgi:arsenate reductase-like glutaredoxin family protein
MSKRSILVISTQKDNKESVLSTWSGIPHPFHLDIASTDEAAIELFQKQDFDMVVVDCTDSNIDHKKLKAVLPILQEDATLLTYQGETEKELEDNVEAVFNAKKFQRIQRMLMLEPSVNTSFNLPPFSLN